MKEIIIIVFMAGGCIALFGVIIGAITMYQSLSSRVISYFITQGIPIHRAKEKFHNKIMTQKYKFY